MSIRLQHDYARHPIVRPEPFDPAMAQAAIPEETRLDLYRKQVEIRQLEKRLYDLFLQGFVRGTSHLVTGMEATGAPPPGHDRPAPPVLLTA